MNAGRTGLKWSLERAFQLHTKASIASPSFLISKFSTSARAFAGAVDNPQTETSPVEDEAQRRKRKTQPRSQRRRQHGAVKSAIESLPKSPRDSFKPHIEKQKHVKPEDIRLNRDPSTPEGFPTSPLARGIRNTSFRLPYISNLKKMDPTFDDPYDVAIQTIRKVQKPGDPEIIIDPDGIYEEDDAEGNQADDSEDSRPGTDGRYEQLAVETGLSADFMKRLDKRNLVRRWVRKQTRMGKIPSYYYLCIAGNRNGLVGFGEGKSSEPSVAMAMASMRAIKALKPILRFEERTVYGELYGKFGSTRIEIRARPPGFGIRANYYVHEICRVAGLTDISAKVRGSLNGMNIAKAVFKVLYEQKSPEQIARERGVHVIDVRQRYFNAYVPYKLD